MWSGGISDSCPDLLPKIRGPTAEVSEENWDCIQEYLKNAGRSISS
jgi:hypothetical protein